MHITDLYVVKVISSFLLLFSFNGFAQICTAEKTEIYNPQHLHVKDSLLYRTSERCPEAEKTDSAKSSEKVPFTKKIRKAKRQAKFSKKTASKTAKFSTQHRITGIDAAYYHIYFSSDRKYHPGPADPDFEMLNNRFRYDTIYNHGVIICKLFNYFFRPSLPLNGQIIPFKSKFSYCLNIRPPPSYILF